MEKLKEYKYIILIGIVILGFTFFWFQLRPSLIKKSCLKEALPMEYADSIYNERQHVYKWNNGGDQVYALCIKRHGI